MKERPILFSGPMVRAILDGRKTQTRRVVKKIPCQCGEWIPDEMCAATPEGWQTVGHSGRWWCECCAAGDDFINCPYGQPGDRLWVREKHRFLVKGYECPHGYIDQIEYAADGTVAELEHHQPYPEFFWRPSIHMPRWASRITLEIINVRVERLQEISHDDAKAEGVFSVQSTEPGMEAVPYYRSLYEPKDLFRMLWDQINFKTHPWAANPWVWVVEFRRCD